ncbi:MAG: SIMPL domain-containing protein [Methyloglobulus sp.]|nr:SIMPL domain-containing protein [Methyloglobulus sp.]
MSSAYAENSSNPYPPSIRVNGTGKISTKPDKADLALSVEVHARTADAARNQAAAAMDTLIRSLINSHVAEKDIQTRSISLYPNYSPDAGNKIIGYQLTNQVAVCVRDVEKAGDIIDSAVKASGNTTRIEGITYGIENPENALTEARKKAYANAKSKAEQYAKLANLTLGAPLYISEGSDIPSTPLPYTEMRTLKAEMVDSSSTPLQAGEQEVTVSVDVMFSIQ